VFSEIAFSHGIRSLKTGLYLEDAEAEFAKLSVGLAEYMLPVHIQGLLLQLTRLDDSLSPPDQLVVGDLFEIEDVRIFTILRSFCGFLAPPRLQL
jgi:hypothetical protein